MAQRPPPPSPEARKEEDWWEEDPRFYQKGEVRRRRRRRRGDVPRLVSQIVTSPTPLTVPQNATPGTLVGTVAVVGGMGTYSFMLTGSAGGKYTIVGNQILVNSALSLGTDTITIAASNGLGDNPTLITSVIVTGVGVHPTYFIYGF